jgi:hypothetical protein
MAECKACGKRGLFLPLNRDSLCGECAVHVPRDIARRAQIAKESMALVEKTANLDTMISRLDLAREQMNVLLTYEQRGIPTTTPPPSRLLAELGRSRGQIIRNGIEAMVAAALAKSGVVSTQRTAVSIAEKALVQLREFGGKTDDPGAMNALEARLAGFIHDRQLEGHLDAARKAEFKGLPKKAIDAYQEALYLLRADRIDDGVQAQQISEIEEKLKRLGGHSG